MSFPCYCYYCWIYGPSLFIFGLWDFCFVTRTHTYTQQTRTAQRKIHRRWRTELKIQAVAAAPLRARSEASEREAAAAVCSCTGEICAWLQEAGSVDLGITHLDSYQGSAGFRAPLSALFGRGALVLPLVSISGLLQRRSRSPLFFLVRSESSPEASHPLLHFLPVSTSPCLCACVCVFVFNHLPLCLTRVINRGAIRGEGHAGESWGRSELHSGCGSHCCGHIKRVHFYPAHGHGL